MAISVFHAFDIGFFSYWLEMLGHWCHQWCHTRLEFGTLYPLDLPLPIAFLTTVRGGFSPPKPPRGNVGAPGTRWEDEKLLAQKIKPARTLKPLKT